jgi:hypothetical protein
MSKMKGVSVVIVYLTIIGALSMAYLAARPHFEVQRHRRKLRTMTADELAEEARQCAKSAGYERAFSNAALFQRQRDWSLPALARAIDELYARAADLDERERTIDAPGSLDDFYAFGLCSVRAALDERPRA